MQRMVTLYVLSNKFLFVLPACIHILYWQESFHYFLKIEFLNFTFTLRDIRKLRMHHIAHFPITLPLFTHVRFGTDHLASFRTPIFTLSLSVTKIDLKRSGK